MAELRRVFSYLRPYRWSFVLALTQVLLITALELLKPWPLKIVLDNVLQRQPLSWGPLAGLDPEALLVAAVTGLILLHVGLGVLSVVNNFATIRVGQSMVNDLRAQLYERLQKMSLQFHSRSSVGDLIYRVTADTFAIQTLAMNGIFPVVASLLLLGGMFVIMLQLSWQLTVVALAIAPLLFIAVVTLNRRITALAMEARERESAVFAHVQRGMSAIRVIQAFTMEEHEQRAFLSSSSASLRASLRLYTLQTVYTGLINVLLAAGTAAVLWLGAGRVWGGQLTIGDLIVFVSYLASLYAPLNSILQTYGMVVGARAGVRRVFEILDQNQPPADGTRQPSPVRGHVVFEDVSFSYEATRLALSHISFEARPGQIVAIVGQTGAGKSTLVSLLPRFIDATSGHVAIDGIDVRDWRLATLRGAISMVLQPPMVFPLSIAENIAYGRPRATAAEIERVARLAGAHEFISRLPQGYGTVIGEQGATLSEGERQRLTIARALLRDAPILILDEPTSSVDAETEALILEGIATLMSGRTTFVIAHRLATIRNADLILVLRDGEIIERGPYAELLENDGPFARLYSAQFGDADAPKLSTGGS